MRKPLFLLLSLLLSLTLVACDGGDGDDGHAEDTTPPAGDTVEPAEDTFEPGDDTVAGLLPFGGECAEDADCESGLCHDFGQGTWCTMACEESTECPEGSEGQKCNKQQVCRP